MHRGKGKLKGHKVEKADLTKQSRSRPHKRDKHPKVTLQMRKDKMESNNKQEAKRPNRLEDNLAIIF